MSAPEISLPRFEGPLDLLLELVRKAEIDIADIPIAEITRQYLDYLHQAQSLDIDLGSDFAYTAALLIHIKSRSLLKVAPDLAAPGEDPREELVRLLLDHEQVRQAAEFLKQKLEVSQATWSKSSLEEFHDPAAVESPSQGGSMNLLEVLRLARQALDSARFYDLVMPRELVSIAQMTDWLKDRLGAAGGPLDGQPLLAEQPTQEHRAALFLAMLDMAKDGIIHLEQQQCFGPIAIEGFPGPGSIHMAHSRHNVETIGGAD